MSLDLEFMHDRAFEELYATGAPVCLLPSQVAITFSEPGRESISRVVALLEGLAGKLRIADPCGLPIEQIDDFVTKACELAGVRLDGGLDPLTRHRLVFLHEKDGVSQSAELFVDSPAPQAAQVLNVAGGGLKSILNGVWGREPQPETDWGMRAGVPPETPHEHELAMAAAGVAAIHQRGGWQLVDEKGDVVPGQPEGGYPVRQQCVAAWLLSLSHVERNSTPDAGSKICM